MQTFLPSPSFEESAKCLDNKRLGKQRIECLQILKCLSLGPYLCAKCGEPLAVIDGDIIACCVEQYKKTPWYNHPAVQMWNQFSESLVAYGVEICKEWKRRGFRDTCEEKIWQFSTIKDLKELSNWKMPPWLGNEKFHASHRSNLLRKNFDYYKVFGWTEANDLPYWWPTKNS